MNALDSILERTLFGLVALVLVGAPWMFGAWEMWWFWPFTIGILLATGCLGARLALSVSRGSARLRLAPQGRAVLLAWLPFLAYAVIRAVQADVLMDAERSLLLHLTSFLVGLMVLIGMGEAHRRTLIAILAANFLLLGVYAIANYALTSDGRVLWRAGFPQYQIGYHRATGSYFCPDHFSGLMEIALALSLGILLTPSTPAARRMGIMPLVLVSLCAIVLTKSRGGSLVTVVLLVCALWWGAAAWPPRLRWLWRSLGAGALALLVLSLTLFGGHYIKRFRDYPWTAFEHWDRYQMSVATLRGWQSAPVWGIGPGMHQNLWPHFAPSPDGDREKGIWPSFTNNGFHSFESHNDWFQLLEEYGAVGIALFLIPAATIVFILARQWRRLTRKASAFAPPHPIVLAGLLALAAMAGHSFGDFNLQIPATSWLLGALIGGALAAAGSEHHRTRTEP